MLTRRTLAAYPGREVTRVSRECPRGGATLVAKLLHAGRNNGDDRHRVFKSFVSVSFLGWFGLCATPSPLVGDQRMSPIRSHWRGSSIRRASVQRSELRGGDGRRDERYETERAVLR